MCPCFNYKSNDCNKILSRIFYFQFDNVKKNFLNKTMLIIIEFKSCIQNELIAFSFKSVILRVLHALNNSIYYFNSEHFLMKTSKFLLKVCALMNEFPSFLSPSSSASYQIPKKPFIFHFTPSIGKNHIKSYVKFILQYSFIKINKICGCIQGL